VLKRSAGSRAVKWIKGLNKKRLTSVQEPIVRRCGKHQPIVASVFEVGLWEGEENVLHVHPAGDLLFHHWLDELTKPSLLLWIERIVELGQSFALFLVKLV
jgi:hypothetical protein